MRAYGTCVCVNAKKLQLWSTRNRLVEIISYYSDYQEYIVSNFVQYINAHNASGIMVHSVWGVAYKRVLGTKCHSLLPSSDMY